MPASINTALATALAVLFLWRVSLLIRGGLTRGRVAAALMFGAYTVPNATNVPAIGQFIGEPGRLINNWALIVFNVAFVYFLALHVGESHRSFLRLRVQIPLAILAVTVLTVSWGVNPAGIRYYPNIGPEPSLQLVLFYVPAGFYLGYMQAVSAWLARKAATHPDTINRWPFWIAAGALLCQCIPTGVIRPVSILARWTAGVTLPPVVELIQSAVLPVGIIGLALALFAIAATTMLTTRRYHQRTRADLAELATLWGLLHDRFASTALPGTTAEGPGRVRILLRPVEAFEDRCTECRDGLWLLSRWVDDDLSGVDAGSDAPLSMEQQARAVYDALHRVAADDEPVGPPVALAAPPPNRSDPDADAEQLLALSRALRTILDAGAPRPAPAA